MYSALDSAVRALGCTVTPQAPLSELTSFRIGGPAARLIELPESAAAPVLELCRQAETPVFWLGKGSNLLVSDHGFDGVILRLTDAAPAVHGTQIVCPAGVPLLRLCRAACERGLSGLEFAYGIPGSVGGAVYMNAGAYGGEMRDVLTEVTLLLPDGSVATRPADTLALAYRHSALMETGGVVLSATVTLTPDDPAAITARMEECMEKRRAKQPLEYPSAGSFFKRPPGQFAGALIEQCGLKGFRVGDAQVSEKHAGFVVNRGHATCADVKALAREVRRRVREQTGFDLVPEVRLLADTWDD